MLYTTQCAACTTRSGDCLPHKTRVVFRNNFKEPGYRIAMASLYELYNLAYFGKWNWQSRDEDYKEIYPRPILEVKDTTAFYSNFDNGTGYYDYNLTLQVPAVRKTELMRSLQNDLALSFPYKASIERRKVKVLKLVAYPKSSVRLKTHGGNPWFTGEGASGGPAGFNYFNTPVKDFLRIVMKYTDDNVTPYLDETGIKTNIDISFDALLTDRNQIRKELKRHGLELVTGEKEMNVVVIKDLNQGIEQ